MQGLFQFIGIAFIFQILQWTVKIEMHEELEKIKLSNQKLKISLTEYNRYKINSFELYYNDCYYDFIVDTITNDSIQLLVIRDSEENEIFNIIKEQTNDQNNSDKGIPKTLIKIFSLWCICTDLQEEYMEPTPKLIKYAELRSYYPSESAENLSPPPKSSLI